METSVLSQKYQNEAIPALKKEFGYGNGFQVPRLLKIVVNTSIKEALQDSKILTAVAEELGMITGQKAVITKARKSIANFKLRQGQAIGCCVTLRGQRMYEFFTRLVDVALPRVRDFKGVSAKGFDGNGNYTLGLTEFAVFPEVNVDKVQKAKGMNITFVTSAKTNEEARALLKHIGMPFRGNA
jgi:large subunit ribosomal protein L5